MNATQRNAPAPTPVPNDALQYKWSGHMADELGATYGPDPLATLFAAANGLILSGTRGTYHLARANVVKIGRGGFYPWFYSSVRIHHSVPGYPRELQFKPLGLKRSEIVAQLRALGYPA